jgi:hypothetical protein
MKFDFLALRKSVQSLAEQVKSLDERIEALKKSREDVETAAASKDDIKAMVSSWIETKQLAHAKALRTVFEPFIRKPGNVLDQARVNQHLTVLGATVQRDQQASTGSMDSVLCGLMGPQLESALHAAIDALEWPPEGLPIARRLVELEKLDGEIASLLEQRNTLTEEARTAGLVIR